MRDSALEEAALSWWNLSIGCAVSGRCRATFRFDSVQLMVAGRVWQLQSSSFGALDSGRRFIILAAVLFIYRVGHNWSKRRPHLPGCVDWRGRRRIWSSAAVCLISSFCQSASCPLFPPLQLTTLASSSPHREQWNVWQVQLISVWLAVWGNWLPEFDRILRLNPPSDRILSKTSWVGH